MNIKSFGLIITVFIVISSVASMLVPKGKMAKGVKFIIALSFISLLIVLFTKVKLDFDYKLSVDTDVSAFTDLYDKTVELTERMLEKKIVAELKAKSVELKSVEINMDILEDESIVIIDTRYSCDDTENEEIIKDTIKMITGCENIERY